MFFKYFCVLSVEEKISSLTYNLIISLFKIKILFWLQSNLIKPEICKCKNVKTTLEIFLKALEKSLKLNLTNFATFMFF